MPNSHYSEFELWAKNLGSDDSEFELWDTILNNGREEPGLFLMAGTEQECHDAADELGMDSYYVLRAGEMRQAAAEDTLRCVPQAISSLSPMEWAQMLVARDMEQVRF